MATWKKVVVSGSNISQLNNDENYLKAVGSGIVSSSAQIKMGGDLTGSADNTTIISGAINNSKVAANAAIEYTKIDFNGSTILSGSIDLSALVTTSSFNSFTASYYTDSASFSSSIADLSASFSTDASASGVFSSSVSTRLTQNEVEIAGIAFDLYVAQGQYYPISAAFWPASQSFSQSIAALNIYTGSVANDSSSISTRVTSLESSASAVQNQVNGFTSSFTTETLIVTGNAAISGTLGVIGNTTFDTDVLIQGDLTVNGTASFVNVEELIVKDKFITLNSGSATLTDAGFIFQSNAAGTGPSLFIEATGTGPYGRMAMATSVSSSATTATAAAYVNTTEIGAGTPFFAPNFGDTTGGIGNMWVNSLTGDIFIYS
jgi:hypothetical protein